MPNELNTVIELLKEKVPAEALKQREQRGRSFTYIEGWYAIQQANEIFGVDGWSYRVTATRPGAWQDERYVVERDVEVTALGVTRMDTGVGISAGDSPEAIETAIKGAVTDGLKRALRTFGDAFGNYLYDKDSYEEAGGHLAQAAREMGLPSRPPTTMPPVCPQHGRAKVGKDGGLYCPTAIGKDGNTTLWCQWKHSDQDEIMSEVGDDYGDLPYA